MNVPEAIKILSQKVRLGPFPLNPQETIAIKLGIEALKRIKLQRDQFPYISLMIMQGETREK